MSSMRDAGVVLVLLLLSATIRVDQPVKATIVPEVQAAEPRSQPAELPAVEQVSTDSEPRGRGCRQQREVRVVHLEGLVKTLDLRDLPTIVLDSAESQMRFVFVESDAPPPRRASPVTVG
jgi:hypothetical protein